MRKLILSFILLFSVWHAYASNVDVAATYIYSSDYNQAKVGAAVPLGINAVVGLEGKYIEDKKTSYLEDPSYSVYLPLQLDLDLIKVNLAPFYYFKNQYKTGNFQDPYAYGVQGQLIMNLQVDEVEELYTQAYLGASFARQKGVLTQDGIAEDANYSQLAYTLGIRRNFFSAFTFHISATAYQYPNGISNVQSFWGIMDQNDLAFTQSFDVSRQLGKYVLSARMTRIWTEERSTLYAGYHFAEFYTDDPQHSILLGNSFHVAPNAKIDAAYNHLQTTDGKNKRDIFFVNLNIAF